MEISNHFIDKVFTIKIWANIKKNKKILKKLNSS